MCVGEGRGGEGRVCVCVGGGGYEQYLIHSTIDIDIKTVKWPQAQTTMNKRGMCSIHTCSVG